MKSLILIFTSALSAQVFAATQVECHLVAGEPVIEQTVIELRLSPDGKTLLQKRALGTSPETLSVSKIEAHGSDGLKIYGSIALKGLACAGSCARRTYTLTINGQAGEGQKNAELERKSDRFDENGRDKNLASSVVDNYSCTFSE